MILGLFAAQLSPAFADTTNTLTSPDSTSNPNTTGFKLISCDGPDLSGLTTSINVTVNGKVESNTPPAGGAPGRNPDGYIPCNFNGVMIQVQHLINVMMVVGVFAAIAAFSYAGFLYVSGSEGNIKKAHEIFPKIFWGFIIMLSAWFIVYQILSWLTGNSAFSSLLGKP